jgi:hypothetical protein
MKIGLSSSAPLTRAIDWAQTRSRNAPDLVMSDDEFVFGRRWTV